MKHALMEFESVNSDIYFLYASGENYAKSLADMDDSPEYGICPLTNKKYEYLADKVNSAALTDEQMASTIALKLALPDGSQFIGYADGKAVHKK